MSSLSSQHDPLSSSTLLHLSNNATRGFVWSVDIRVIGLPSRSEETQNPFANRHVRNPVDSSSSSGVQFGIHSRRRAPSVSFLLLTTSSIVTSRPIPRTVLWHFRTLGPCSSVPAAHGWRAHGRHQHHASSSAIAIVPS